MAEATVQTTADQLFLRWKQFLDGGTLTEATLVAGEHPDLVDPLQRLINSYISDRAARVEVTLSVPIEVPLADPVPVLPEFTILGPLGAGGMGVVYRVRDALDRELALKMAHHAQLTEAGRRRFHDEAKAMARLDHPHIAPVVHYGEYAGRPYFLMPIYPGNLTSRLAEYQADPIKAVRLMAAVADGVGHLHAKGFIHRDLKPHNILLKSDGQPAVSDFGLVKNVANRSSEAPAAENGHASAETKVDEERRVKTVVGAAMGTRAYMAPEQAAGLAHLASPRWDVWALGVILHELLTGQRPRSSDAPERLLDPNHPDNPPASFVNRGLDPRLARIVAKCLARDERQRYANGADVAVALRRVVAPPRARKFLLRLGITTLIVALLIAIAIPLLPRPTPVETPVIPPFSAFLPSEQEPEFDKVRETLRAGQSVTLVGSTGMPVHGYTLIGSKDNAKPFVSQMSNELKIDASRTLFMALIDDPGIVRYRIELEALQLTANPSAQVGLFQGMQRVESADGPVWCFAVLAFNKHLVHTARKTGSSGLKLRRFDPPSVENGQSSGLGEVVIAVPPLEPQDQPADVWMTLAVSVRPDQSSWSINGRPVGTIVRPVAPLYRPSLEVLMNANDPATIDISPAGSVGLFVANSSARFRNVVITPATDP